VTTLLCFGLGYSARHYVARYGARYRRVIATARTATAGSIGSNAEVCRFDGVTASAAIAAAIAAADAILVSIPPTDGGDPVLAGCARPLAQVLPTTRIVYLSSVGVYGDHGGAIVDETTVPRPGSARGVARLAAETGWLRWGQDTGATVGVLRLAGIYGPGRNPLVQVASGRAQAILKTGQVFNRIHVADIAQSIEAAFTWGGRGVFNVADDEPAPPQDVLGFAAALLGAPPPPQVAWADAAANLSPLARSFYAQNKRVSIVKAKTLLDFKPAYPTYREGLQALFAAGQGRSEENLSTDKKR